LIGVAHKNGLKTLAFSTGKATFERHVSLHSLVVFPERDFSGAGAVFHPDLGSGLDGNGEFSLPGSLKTGR
jgi:hypothetical protein